MAEYEFTAEQNQTIDQLRQKLWQISLMLIIAGILLLVVGHGMSTTRGVWYSLVPAACFIVLGFVYYRPLDNLKRVITTKGHDIFEMMIAMDDLRIAFATAQIIFIILIVMEIAELSRMIGF